MLPYLYIVVWVGAIVGLEMFDHIREGIADVVEDHHKHNQQECPVNGDPEYVKNFSVWEWWWQIGIGYEPDWKQKYKGLLVKLKHYTLQKDGTKDPLQRESK